jgi:squalene-hopene/tetraprenyl-beta-curcumene cyclase
MFARTVVLLVIASAAACGDWNPKLAAEYLDSRQKEWFAWPAANRAGTPCISCHTGAPYLLVRPALRRVLGETSPTTYEDGLLEALRSRVVKGSREELFPKSKGAFGDQATGVEAVLAALLLANQDVNAGTLSPATETALARMWTLQVRSGKLKGAWNWFNLDLDPWEMPESPYYGASLAALAVGSAPGYQDRAELQENLAELKSYLHREQLQQPLHNRLALLAASVKLQGLLTGAERTAILGETLGRQASDGGWTLAALGDWKKHEKAPVAARGSDSYATALVAFTLEQTGMRSSNPALARALEWLKTRQDARTGAWLATSMNKSYEAGSIPERFMQDAATSYAVLALTGAK